MNVRVIGCLPDFSTVRLSLSSAVTTPVNWWYAYLFLAVLPDDFAACAAPAATRPAMSRMGSPIRIQLRRMLSSPFRSAGALRIFLASGGQVGKSLEFGAESRRRRARRERERPRRVQHAAVGCGASSGYVVFSSRRS